MTPKKLEDDLVEVVGTLVIEVALHQRRMRRAIRLGILGLVLIAAAFAGAVYLAVDTRTVVSRSPCVNLRAPSCFRKLVTNASPHTLAILKRRLAAQERRARARERRRLNRRRDSGPVIKPAAPPRPKQRAPRSSRPAPSTSPGDASAPPAAPSTRPVVDVPAPTVTTPAGTLTVPSFCARPVGGVGCS
jgi:hypothetical protein